mgnify:CR=1 FL=1
MSNVEKELNAGHNVIIDTGNLSVGDLEALQTEITEEAAVLPKVSPVGARFSAL